MRLRAARLVLVGAGGTGCQYIYNAVRLFRSAAVVVKVIVIDGDTVTGVECPDGHPVLFGLHQSIPHRCPVCDHVLVDKMERQFTRVDVGQNKAKVVANQLRAMFQDMPTSAGSSIAIEEIGEFLTSVDDILGVLGTTTHAPTLIAAMVDNHESRRLWDQAIAGIVDSRALYRGYHQNLSLLSAGNDTTDAEALLASYAFDEVGKRVTLSRLAPDIQSPGLGLPTAGRRERCGVDTGPTQSLIANTSAALAALDLTQVWLRDVAPHYTDINVHPKYNHTVIRLPGADEWSQASYQRLSEKPHLIGL